MGTPRAASETVRTNVRLARMDRGFSVRTVSRLLAEHGHRLAPSAISKIELGQRRIDVDDVAAFAAIFEVSVLDLFTAPDEGRFVPMPTDLAAALEDLAASEAMVRMATLHQHELDALIATTRQQAERARQMISTAELPSTRRPGAAPRAVTGSSTTTSKGAPDGIHRQDHPAQRSS